MSAGKEEGVLVGASMQTGWAGRARPSCEKWRLVVGVRGSFMGEGPAAGS